ncbi:MAG: SDR family oxidoreductase, partial [Hyphomicrobiales bacterium]
MLLDLSGKVAIVTGAGRGIGREIARTFAREGVTVVGTDFRQELLDDLAAEWQREGWQGLQLRGDARLKADAQAVADATDKAFGRIDILVNNAGVASGAKVEELAEDVWDDNFDTNTKGVMLMCQAVIPVMKRQKSGRILNAASYAAIT